MSVQDNRLTRAEYAAIDARLSERIGDLTKRTPSYRPAGWEWQRLAWHAIGCDDRDLRDVELVLRFVIPEVVVGGVTEEEGRAWWRSRLRADVLVNGHPAWSTEALRLRADYRVRHPTDPMETVRRPLVVLQQFGEPLAFPTNDEDLPPTSGGPSNDTGIENADYPAERKVVYLNLGRFAAGAQIELSLVMHGIALTVPTSPGGSDHRCRERDVPDTWFCSRASLAVNGGVNDSPRLYLVP